MNIGCGGRGLNVRRRRRQFKKRPKPFRLRRRLYPLRLKLPLPVPPGYRKVEAQYEGTPLAIIAEAARSLHPVRFYYTRRDGVSGEYEVHPYSVRVGYPGNDTYLFAFHPFHGSIHSFVLDRIESPTPVEEEQFVPIWEIEF